MSDLWYRWREHHRENGLDPELLCEDGRLSPELYEKASPRVVFVLKETDDYVGGLPALLENGPVYQMWHAVARWAAGLLNDFPPFELIDTPQAMSYALRQVAVVNLKKSKGKAESDDEEVEEHMMRDRELLIEQFVDLRPRILVAGGTFSSVLRLLNLNERNSQPQDKPVLSSLLNAWVLKTRHPNRAGNRKTYEELKRWWEMTKLTGS